LTFESPAAQDFGEILNTGAADSMDMKKQDAEDCCQEGILSRVRLNHTQERYCQNKFHWFVVNQLAVPLFSLVPSASHDQPG
jgi:hypothetical protein